ncbi:hypothetical protein BK138_32295 [Paenibacillus rhizosphaerae]|uniref:Uncharacterized protein n=1 Tax=Paenibacillus rhizosphaerae TaxID=297318 RepID=A0A1R1E670_9BACL|nr:hypothetical protein [Paenibacillus rhizosphaerae]OMF47315.1 hypothetical protein BK138_32295 [Paenibacillus rhizosphaerae]
MDNDEILKQILSELKDLKSGQNDLSKKIDWAVAELKNDAKASNQAMTLFTPVETTEAIERDIRAIKLKLFDVESKLNRR